MNYRHYNRNGKCKYVLPAVPATTCNNASYFDTFPKIEQHLPNGLINGRCCSILGNVNAYIQDMGTWM